MPTLNTHGPSTTVPMCATRGTYDSAETDAVLFPAVSSVP
jgi:hypothetical protein